MLLRCGRGTCNFEASLHRALTNRPLFWPPRGNTQITGTRRNRRGDTYRNVLNSPLFHNIWDPDTGSVCRIFRWWPDATHRIPLLLWVLNQPPPIKSLIHAPTHVSHYLKTRRSLHVAPWLCVILSEMAADSANMAIPESGKKFRWIKCGLLTKSCTQRMSLCSSSAQIITRSKLMMNCPPQVTGPRTRRAVSWKTWKNKIKISQLNDHATLP